MNAIYNEKEKKDHQELDNQWISIGSELDNQRISIGSRIR
mgnify:CR=1 FL=1